MGQQKKSQIKQMNLSEHLHAISQRFVAACIIANNSYRGVQKIENLLYVHTRASDE